VRASSTPRSIGIAVLLLSGLSVAAPPPVHGQVTFTAHGPAGLKIAGHSSALSVKEDDRALSFTLELATLETGIEVRDRHMRDDLQVQTFPTAELRIDRGRLQMPPHGGQVKGTCPGALTLHGQSHDVAVSYEARSGHGYEVSGSFQIDLRDYGIAPPTYLGVSVKPDVQVVADLHLDIPE